MRNNMDPAEYKHVVLGLIFLKYISDAFAENLKGLLGGQFLFFHDAIAPIVEADSIDPEKTRMFLLQELVKNR